MIWNADKPVSGKAVFEVTLLPSMEVLKVEKLSSSGSSSYERCRTRDLENAVSAATEELPVRRNPQTGAAPESTTLIIMLSQHAGNFCPEFQSTQAIMKNCLPFCCYVSLFGQRRPRPDGD